MKTIALWEQYQQYTKTLTDHSRKLAFAGAAICWFFKTPEITFPNLILKALGLIVLFFLFDILHYLLGAIMVGVWTRRQEVKAWKREQKIPDELDKPAWLDLPSQIFFGAKILVLIIAFSLIGLEFYQRTKIPNQRVDPTVTTPVESGKVQGTAGHP